MIELQESHRQRILVTADDFGISQRANRNTLYLISLGKINRVGIMSHGEISAKEIDELYRSKIKLDIHLDILHELGKNRNKRQGAIFRIVEFLGKILTGKISTQKVNDDWEQQIMKFHSLFGKYPDGINSHEHIHFFPPFFRVALNLQKKYNIPYVRFGNSIQVKHHTIIAHILQLLTFFNQKKFLQSGCNSSDSLISLDWISDMDKFLDNLPEGKIEIACHPELAEDFVKIKNYF